MRDILLTAALIASPVIGSAQEVPVYLQEGGELVYTGETMLVEDVLRHVTSENTFNPFGVPIFIANNRGEYIPSFQPPEYYELLLLGDGKIEGAPDDLVFDEGEGTDTRDGLTFDESEGLDTTETMTFDESEGTDTTDDMTFDEAEGADTTETLTFREDEAMKAAEAEGVPADVLSFAQGPVVTPQDGQWTITILESVAKGCPPGSDAAARAQILRTRSLNVTFSKPEWHPSDLSPELAQYDWQRVGQNGYFTYPYATGEEAEGSGVSLAVSTAYFARSSTQIDMWYRVRANLAPELAAMAGSAEQCEVLILGELVK